MCSLGGSGMGGLAAGGLVPFSTKSPMFLMGDLAGKIDKVANKTFVGENPFLKYGKRFLAGFSNGGGLSGLDGQPMNTSASPTSFQQVPLPDVSAGPLTQSILAQLLAQYGVRQ